MCGYALTGSTKEHALFFLHGDGGNGKGVFLQTVSRLIYEYQCNAPISTFTVSQGDRHPTEIADLCGARLVTVAETEQGRQWSESLIKQLTGGDPMKARFMRQDLFEFTPQLTLVISGNHKPTLNTVDMAIRRRMNLIPFTVTIGPEEKDVDLPDKLEAEWPGILQWMIEGCLDWQKQGLAAPQSVIDATNEYLANEDALATWLLDKCETKPCLQGKRKQALRRVVGMVLMTLARMPASRSTSSTRCRARAFARSGKQPGECSTDSASSSSAWAISD